MNEKNRAFTLIELLIVVAIIAILAAIAVPNFLEAQVRSKISRAQSDMRSLSTAIEAYSVDHAGTYPAAVCLNRANESNGRPCTLLNAMSRIGTTATLPYGVIERMTFAVPPGLQHLTSPSAYITSYPPDPFASTRGACFGYINMKNKAWIMYSYGPDCDENKQGQIGLGQTRNGTEDLVPRIRFDLPKSAGGSAVWSDDNNTLYSDRCLTPSPTFLTAGYTYDTTNGSKSAGDIWRVKQ